MSVSHSAFYSKSSTRLMLNLDERSCLIANHPVPVTVKLFYFEIEIMEDAHQAYVTSIDSRSVFQQANISSIIGLGLGNEHTPLRDNMPGWTSDSWGYHGDDGCTFHDGDNDSYEEKTFAKGDVIGCLYELENSELSYTLNGEILGTSLSHTTDLLESGTISNYEDK
jgi:hypothetical protein